MTDGNSWATRLSVAQTATRTLRPDFRITLYGSFFPEIERSRLVNLCAGLQAEGFTDCGIIGGPLRPNPPTEEPGSEWDADTISYYYLRKSDANIMVGTHGGALKGMIHETVAVVYKPELLDAHRKTVVLNQHPPGKHSALDKLTLDLLRKTQIPVVSYSNEDEIPEYVLGQTLRLFREKYL